MDRIQLTQNKIMNKWSWVVRFLFAALIFIIHSNSLSAQNALSISSTGSGSFDFKSVYRPGGEPGFFSDDSKWLNYTVLLKNNDINCSVKIQITSGHIPDGVRIKVRALNCAGFNRGNPGIPVGDVDLSMQPKVLIDNIGTCFTGSGNYSGHQLIYTIEFDDFERVKSELSALTVLYTISQ